MGPDPITYVFYPFLSITLFFETFLLLTFLSKPARYARARGHATATPTVALIVPCYNEEATVVKTAESALAVDYPKDKLQVILVDDGSKDNTWKVMQQFKNNPRVILIHQENGGKHTALNAGIAATNAEIVGCLDADSYLEKDAVTRTLACFEKENVAAAFSAIAISTPKRMIEHMQSAEYSMGVFFRHALASINAFFVTPGPFSLYRRDILVKIGGFRFGQQTEDMEIALRLLREGYAIDNAPGALVSTYAQTTARKLVKQRTRWISGYFRNVLFDYRDLFNKKFGALGLIILPMGLIAPLIVIVTSLIGVYLFVKDVLNMYFAHRGLPLSWYVSQIPHMHFDWFYTPANTLLILSILAAGLGVSMAFIGKRISGTPTNMLRGVVLYLLCYGFISPFWFARSIYDVTTGTRRGWR